MTKANNTSRPTTSPGATTSEGDEWNIPSLSASRDLSEQSDGRTARAIIWSIALGIILLIYWAAMTPVYEIITGNGIVRPEGLSTRLEHSEGGPVSSINFSQGERVAKGEVIMRIDDSSFLAELQKVRAKLDGLDNSIARYQNLLALDITDPKTYDNLDVWATTNPSFFEEITYRISQIDTMRSQRNVAQKQQETMVFQLASMREEAKILRRQLARYESSEGQRVIPLNQMEDIRREVLRLESNIAEMTGQIAVQTATLEQMRSAEAEMIAKYRSEASLSLADQQQERLATAQTLSQVQDRIIRSNITAPVSGYINSLSVQNVGEVISPGEVIAEIIPENERAFAEVEIPANAIGGISVGQAARIKILTYDFTRFGDVSAFVERISPSSFTRENGDVFFRVRLSFSDDDTSRIENNSNLKQPITSGMTVVADIRSESRSILTFLLKPFRLVVDRAFTEA